MKKKIDAVIEDALNEMCGMKVGTSEYEVAAKNVEILCKARSYKNESSISTDTLVVASVSIAEILLVLYFERFNVLSSRAINWILKLKA